MLTSILVALTSSFPFAIAGPDSNASALLALMAGAIAAALPPDQAAERLLPTIFAALIVATLSTGCLLLALGRLRLGRWVRFVPYPVMGGFLAGTGWLIVRGAFQIMTNTPLGLAQLPDILALDSVYHWLPGLGVALALFGVARYTRHYVILPVALLVGIGLVHAGLWLSNTTLSDASAAGWLFQAFPDEPSWTLRDTATFSRIDWMAVIRQSGTMAAMMLVVVLTLLLNATGIEVATQQDGDLDRELRAHGMANLLSGVCGGVVGYLSISRSLLNYQAGARHPLSGVTAGLFCGAVFWLGTSFLPYIPKLVLGGLVLYAGLGLLVEWVYRARAMLPRAEYLIVLLIMVVIGAVGFLEGVGVGVMVAVTLFAINYSRIDVTKHVLSGVSSQSNVARPPQQEQFLRQHGGQIHILKLQNFIFFGTAHSLLTQIRQRLSSLQQSPLRFIVLDFHLVSGLDSSAVLSFIKIRQTIHRHQCRLVLTALPAAVERLLRQGRCLTPFGDTIQVFPDLDRGLEWCENQLLQSSAADDQGVQAIADQLQAILPQPQQIAQFVEYLECLMIPQGQTVFNEGDPPDGLYFLEAGQVSVLRALPNGRMQRLRTYNSGTIVGEMGLYENAPRSASVIADQVCRFYYLSPKAFESMEREAPMLAIAFHKYVVALLAGRLRHHEAQTRSLLQ
jgi:SulP family sulfate permease